MANSGAIMSYQDLPAGDEARSLELGSSEPRRCRLSMTRYRLQAVQMLDNSSVKEERDS